MIVDLIIERKEEEKYRAYQFYLECMDYYESMPDVVGEIVHSMDSGTEKQVKKALCDYIINNRYNPKLCKYINKVKWL